MENKHTKQKCGKWDFKWHFAKNADFNLFFSPFFFSRTETKCKFHRWYPGAVDPPGQRKWLRTHGKCCGSSPSLTHSWSKAFSSMGCSPHQHGLFGHSRSSCLKVMGTTRTRCRGCFPDNLLVPVGDWTISTGVEHLELSTHPDDGNDGDDAW